ncbi:hypothetical protein NDN01_08195 [Sphingomonas sp. QA11]|uniref:hypothetical protein n=1 Tax=Sphingomonas sp. QA11 TaxID=2950605 RepID=UPI00234AA7E6|nr:hypothetical protein [Sphingomonas sp. QA11]WCM28868.1 hypothetical protein NDN01_08195 [Sphingomonas sp. QA11]
MKVATNPIRPFFSLCALVLALTLTSQSNAREGCGLYPEETYEYFWSMGFSACPLKRLGQRPLWRNFAGKDKKVMRFVFTEGHGHFFRYVLIREKFDGTGKIETGGVDYHRDSTDPIPIRRSPLTAQQLTKLNALATQAKIWEFPIEHWDSKDDVFVDCQLLEMEMAADKDYRYSQVTIGCNQPEQLMPFVDEVARLGGLTNANWQIFQ